MPTNDALGAKPPDNSDWSNAFEAVSRLAAAREAAFHPAEPERRSSATDRQATSSAATRTTMQDIDTNQLARAVAEIEKASAALRRSEPALEVGLPAPARSGTRKR